MFREDKAKLEYTLNATLIENELYLVKLLEAKEELVKTYLMVKNEKKQLVLNIKSNNLMDYKINKEKVKEYDRLCKNLENIILCYNSMCKQSKTFNSFLKEAVYELELELYFKTINQLFKKSSKGDGKVLPLKNNKNDTEKK